MLKNITTDLISKCKKKEITLSEYVILDNQQIKVKGELKDDCYQDGNFIGTFIFKELKFEASNEYNFKKKEIQYHKVIDGVDVNYGNFIVTEIKDNDTNKIAQVVAMDYGLKTQIKYKSSLNYSSGNITLLNVWNECCTLSNLESGITSFTNSDFIVDSNQFENSDVLVRDVMIAISQMACGFVKVMNDNKAYIMLQEETTDIIDEYVELEDKKDTQPINAVSLGVSNIEGNNTTKIANGVNPNNANWLVINDNPFAYTATKRQQLIEGIFNKINGFGYSSFISKSSFKPYLTCGDRIQFRNREGELINSIVLRYNHNFENITLEAPSIIKATVNYVSPESPIEAIKRTEIIVNQQNQVITQVVKNANEQNQKIAQITQTVDELVIEVQENSSNIASLTITSDSISQEVASQTTSINKLGQTISQINSVIQEQTDNAITTWFNQSGIQGTLDQLQQAIDSNDEDIETIKSYYKVALDDDQSSSHYGETYVELGAENNQTKIRIYPNVIQFLTNGEQTAYISNNSLYISESTILTKQQIGHWVTTEDEVGNLNTYWVEGV